MNYIALSIGVLLAGSIAWFFHRKSAARKVYSYSWLLFTFPLYYFAFAISASDYKVLPLELFTGLVFFIAPLVVRLMKIETFLLLLSSLYILHGIYDVMHNSLFVNQGTPVWWPEFCGIVDILLGVYLLTYVSKLKKRI